MTASMLTSDTEPKPIYRLKVGSKDITGRFQGRLIGLTLTDNPGFEADQLDIELDDSDGRLELPEKGVRLALSIGWADTGVVDKGTFKVDELEHTGPPDRLTIRARSADLDGGLTTRRDNSYAGKTIGAIVQAIATRNKLTSMVSKKLAGKVIEHVDQTGESDANFLTRLAREFDAIATVKNGTLLFIPAGEPTSGSGIALPKVTITRDAGDTHTFLVADRENYNGVKAYYQDTRAGARGEVVIDASNVAVAKERRDGKVKKRTKKAATVAAQPNPDNVKVLRHTYASKANAERAARAEWRKIQRGVATFTLTLARGRPDLFPSLHASVTGWKQDIDNTAWSVGRVTHNLNDRGYTSSLELEIKPEKLEESGTPG
ncbi:phage late control D family protein [Ralstonia pseudosolanacearum]|uniref:phage late control D family protein n=1 Tax=Ralstonia pseudosolanacearum TaxID=1310165 RepID=UPI0009BD3E2F|nr:phage late control D family protein [Ralstonia pseudosolanacearum]MDC6294000.1 phage late control D family protein [Ralstonia pseudosolanacearum]MDD7788897.1 phage late control D family protein [Ralstonia pseudosolanacearum]MDN3367861.1 phage late control D family protein [Ralstonia pseudosolanacearum]QOK87753.1 phage late control D family protein [Ralstonia pseudosolanacearum]